MTVRMPFSAPAWPPETGASTKAAPRSAAAPASSRATAAEAVVWSTKTASRASVSKAPSGPTVTALRSSSLPTQAKTISAPSAAAAGGGRRGVAVLGHPGLGAARRAVVDGDVVALGGEVAGHGIAHDAQADESDARHADSLAPLTLRCVVSPLVACYPGGVKAEAKGTGAMAFLFRWLMRARPRPGRCSPPAGPRWPTTSPDNRYPIMTRR